MRGLYQRGMAMKFRKTGKSSTPLINTTPLLDAVFILLIFFAVSTTFFYVGAIKVELPKASTSLENQSNSAVRVVVTKENNLFIDGKPVAEADLYAVLKSAGESAEGASLVIEADTNSLHGIVVKVIDAGKLAGFEKFAIATEEPE